MTIRLSIVIPAYNVAGYIGEAISSALAQTLDGIEVVVVNDGSTDTTPEVIAGFDDPRLRVVHQPNGGLSNARNTGIRHARGQFIGFLDGDDRWHPDKAWRHCALMEADPTIGISYSHSSYIDETGRDTGNLLVNGVRRPSLSDMIQRNCVGNGSSPVVRAVCFEQAGLFDEELRSCEDWEMWVRILRDTGFSAQLIPEVLTAYRINTQSLSFNFEGFLQNAERAAAKIKSGSPAVSPALVARGLAMCYRIAGSKAMKIGETDAALRLLWKAVRISPAMLVTDPRLYATLAAVVAPERSVAVGQRMLQWRSGIRPRRVGE